MAGHEQHPRRRDHAHREGTDAAVARIDRMTRAVAALRAALLPGVSCSFCGRYMPHETSMPRILTRITVERDRYRSAYRSAARRAAFGTQRVAMQAEEITRLRQAEEITRLHAAKLSAAPTPARIEPGRITVDERVTCRAAPRGGR